MDIAKCDIEKLCPGCGKRFAPKQSESPTRFQRRITCSRGCRNRYVAQQRRVHKTCAVCEREFSVSPGHAGRYSTCSPECLDNYRKQKQAQRYELSVSEESKAKRHATFMAQRFSTVCGCGCGTAMLLPQNRIKNHKGERFFLNREHYERWFRGDNVAWFNGGTVDYYGPNWTIQRARARRRDRVCLDCGVSPEELGQALDVHHLRPFRACDDYVQANQLDNLACLCHACHMRRHTTHTADAGVARQ